MDNNQSDGPYDPVELLKWANANPTHEHAEAAKWKAINDITSNWSSRTQIPTVGSSGLSSVQPVGETLRPKGPPTKLGQDPSQDEYSIPLNRLKAYLSGGSQ